MIPKYSQDDTFIENYPPPCVALLRYDLNASATAVASLTLPYIYWPTGHSCTSAHNYRQSPLVLEIQM